MSLHEAPSAYKHVWPSPGLGDPSALFRHEVAFALGQMRVRATP